MTEPAARDTNQPRRTPRHEDGSGSGVTPPRQARSRRTLERLLAAATDLLRERSFDDIPVREICDRAGYTVGAFYARFDGKDVLLERLQGRTIEKFEAIVEEHLSGPRWTRPETEQRLAELFSALLRFHRRERGMLRTLLERSREDGRPGRALERMDEGLARRIDARLPRARGSWAHPDPERGIRTALHLVLGAIRASALLAGPDPLAGELDDRQRGAALARAFVGAAGIGSAGGSLFR